MGKVRILFFKYNGNDKLIKSILFFPYIYIIFFSCFFLRSVAQDKYSIKDLSNLITTNECNKCNLEGIDLVNKDLSNAQITNSNLKNANLSGGYLDNVNFYGTDLSWTTLALGDFVVKLLLALIMLIPFRLLMTKLKDVTEYSPKISSI